MGPPRGVFRRVDPDRRTARRPRRGVTHRGVGRGDGHPGRDSADARAKHVDHVRDRHAHRDPGLAERARCSRARRARACGDRGRARSRCGQRRARPRVGRGARAFAARHRRRCCRAHRRDALSLVRLPRIAEPLRHRDFRLLWLGQTVSVFGNFVHGVALPFQILAIGGGPLEIGLWGAIFSIASIVFLLLGGAVADRVPRRRLILANDLACGIAVAAIAALSATGNLRVGHLYVEAFVFGATHSFFEPALNAIIPELVPPEILQTGNAVRGTSRQIALIGGPIVGGLVIAGAGLPAAFGLDAATFFASFGAVWLARPPRREPAAAVPILRQVRGGLASTLSVPWLCGFIFALV